MTNEEAFAPVTLKLVIVSSEPPVLVSVTDFEALAVPTCSSPYDKLAADSDTDGGVTTAVP